MKELVKSFLRESGYQTVDCGAFRLEEGDDYPQYIAQVANLVAQEPRQNRGIIFGGSGQGEAMSANTFPGVRAAVYYGMVQEIVTLSRTHNDANILSIGARFIRQDEILGAVSQWLSTEFSHDERHVRRIAQVESLKSHHKRNEHKYSITQRRSVVPAILEEDSAEVEKKLSLVQDVATWAQIDIKDGVFAQGKTCQLSPGQFLLSPVLLEVHLMVEQPFEWIERCKDAGFARVLFHVSAQVDARECLAAIHHLGMEAGIVLSPEDDPNILVDTITACDVVGVMGVVPGRSGQAMLPETIERVRLCRRISPWAVKIEVDGGVQADNIADLVSAGADLIVAGSAVYSAGIHPIEAFRRLESRLLAR